MYHPTGRVLTVLELLQARPGLTGQELADRLETDVRTVRRYVAKLQDVGIPVEANPGRYGGYFLRPGYRLPPLIFSEEEAIAVILGLAASPWLEVQQSAAVVESALSKITRVLPEKSKARVHALADLSILGDHNHPPTPTASMLLSIGDAIEASLCLDLHYEAQAGIESSRTRRTVEPYGVVGKLGKWYLVAYCRLRKDFRTFRLDRALSLDTTGEVFQPSADFDFRAYAEKNLTWYPGKWVAEILFLGDLRTVRARLPASYDGSLEPREDGVYSRWPIDGPRWACRYLLYAEVPFKILGPPELLAAMSFVAEEAKRVAAGQPNWDPPGA